MFAPMTRECHPSLQPWQLSVIPNWELPVSNYARSCVAPTQNGPPRRGGMLPRGSRAGLPEPKSAAVLYWNILGISANNLADAGGAVPRDRHAGSMMWI